MAEQKILFEGGVSNVLFTDRREFYPEPQEIYEYHKNVYPWLTWLQNLPVKSVPDPLYKMFEDVPTFQNQYLLVNNAAVTIAANGTESGDVAVDTITNITQAGTADDSLIGLVFEVWNSTGTTKKGQVFVSDVSSTTAIKFKTLKGVAVTTADNDIMRCIGTVRGERSVAGKSYYNELKVVWNSTHYHSLPIEITGKLAKEARLRGTSDEMARLREKTFKDMKYKVQNSLLKSSSTVGTNFNGSDTFSEASLRSITDVAGNSSSVRTTYGYIPILEDYGTEWTGNSAIDPNTNIFTVPVQSLNFDTFQDMNQVIFDKRESTTIPGFCGFGFLTELNKKVNDKTKFGFQGKVELSGQRTNAIGLDVREFFTGVGTIQLTPTKLLDNEYANYCLLPNDQAIGIAEYEPWQYLADIKKDDNYNGVKDVFNYDAGLKMELLKTHHLIRLVK